MPRFYCPCPLTTGALMDLPAGAARHVQVLRLQPGDAITLFNGDALGEFSARVTQMGRSSVQVQVGSFVPTQREPALRVHSAVGMPANERMDWLVEKATELGVASIQPLMTAHSVLRLKGERAEKKQAHWQAIAVSWGIALFEYCLAVPANRLGYGEFTGFQLKIIQEVATLVIFVAFAVLFLKEKFAWNYASAFVCLAGAAYFAFAFKPPAA